MTSLLTSIKKVEGINYIDSSPVSIEFENGVITKVEKIASLSDNKNPLFIAPGLIDMQINGYLSVSFALEGSDNSRSEERRVGK